MASTIKVDKIAQASGTPEFTIPTADGAANTFLKTDGSGVLSFDSVTTTALTGSTATWIPTITGANALTGTANFTYDGNVLDVKNSGTASSIKLYCESSNAHAQEIKAAPHAGSSAWTLTLPPTVPSVSGQALTATTAGVSSWATVSGGLVLLASSASAVDVGTIDFEDFRDSTLYENYRIVGRMRNATNNVAWRMRFMAGSSAVTTSTYIGAGNGFAVWSVGSGVFNWGDWNADNFNLFQNGSGAGIDSDVAQLFDLTVHLQHSGSISSNSQITGTMSFWGHTDAQYAAVYGGTYATSATDITGIQFYYASGNITEHDIDVYGIVKS